MAIGPNGDFILKRNGKIILPIDAVQIGDTLKITLTTSGATPFKSVSLLSADQKIIAETRKANLFVLAHPIAQDALPYSLVLRGPLTLARVQVSIATSLVRPQEMIVLQNDTSIVKSEAAKGKADTVVSTYEVVGNNPILADERGIVYDSNRIIRYKIERRVKPIVSPLITLQPKGEFKLSGLGWRRFCYDDFQRQDSLYISVTASGKKPRPFNWVARTDEHTSLKKPRLIRRKTSEFLDTLVIAKEQELSLYVKGKIGLKKPRADILVCKRSPTQYDTTYWRTDSIFTERVVPVFDTILLPLLDVTNEVANTLNIEKDPFLTIPINAPVNPLPEAELKGIYYWIGIDQAVVDAFKIIEEEAAAIWPVAGVSAALAAYGMGNIDVLPAVLRPELNFAFTDLAGKRYMERNRLLSKRLLSGDFSGSTTFGKIDFSVCIGDDKCIGNCYLKCRSIYDPQTEQNVYSFFLNFLNTSGIDTIPVSVKIIGFYTQIVEWVKTTELIEVKQYKVELP